MRTYTVVVWLMLLPLTIFVWVQFLPPCVFGCAQQKQAAPAPPRRFTAVPAPPRRFTICAIAGAKSKPAL
jgi:hypothetical protein